MYDTLIIDLDGPLFDGRSAMVTAMKSTIENFKESHGTPVPNLTSLPLLAPTALINVVYSDSDAPPADLGPVCDYYREVLKQAEDATRIAPSVQAWLDKMVQNKWSLAVLTSRREAEAKALLRGKGVTIEVIVGRDSGPTPKPSGAGIASILGTLGKSPASAVMVGDSDSDFAAAGAAGIAYIHAGWSSEPSTVQLLHPSLVFRRPQDIYNVFLEFPAVTPAPAGLPDDLVKAIELGDLGWFAGAGASIPSGFGGWDAQYRPLLEQTGASWMSKIRDLPDILQLACTTDEGSVKVFDEFKKSFRGPAAPNHYHFAILRSLARRVWTSNYDQLFERAISNAGLDQTVVKDDVELLNNFAAGRLVIKVNGDFENATFKDHLRWGVVLTRQQFDRALTERPEIWRLFEDDFRNRSLVFVGVSFQDPILRQVVAIATDRIPKTHYTHYLLAKIPETRIEQTLQGREAKNLEKFRIQTLWFETHDDIRRFVSRVAVVARRPIIGVSGSTRKGQGPDDDTVVLENGQRTAAQLQEVNIALGEVLARKGYRVTSGGAPYIGAAAVEAAFKIKSSCARIYFREGGGSKYKRLAPAIIVEGIDYPDMRRRFIGELSLLVAMGGGQPADIDNGVGGVTDEIRMAAKRGVPVLLFPQAGGEVERLNQEQFRKWYPGDALWPALKEANEACAAVPAAELINFIRQGFGSIVDSVLEASMECMVNAQAFNNNFSSEYSW
jgi:phosphoglycolate phosphatase-like HAD superfamily hydrolase